MGSGAPTGFGTAVSEHVASDSVVAAQPSRLAGSSAPSGYVERLSQSSAVASDVVAARPCYPTGGGAPTGCEAVVSEHVASARRLAGVGDQPGPIEHNARELRATPRLTEDWARPAYIEHKAGETRAARHLAGVGGQLEPIEHNARELWAMPRLTGVGTRPASIDGIVTSWYVTSSSGVRPAGSWNSEHYRHRAARRLAGLGRQPESTEHAAQPRAAPRLTEAEAQPESSEHTTKRQLPIRVLIGSGERHLSGGPKGAGMGHGTAKGIDAARRLAGLAYGPVLCPIALSYVAWPCPMSYPGRTLPRPAKGGRGMRPEKIRGNSAKCCKFMQIHTHSSKSNTIQTTNTLHIPSSANNIQQNLMNPIQFEQIQSIVDELKQLQPNSNKFKQNNTSSNKLQQTQVSSSKCQQVVTIVWGHLPPPPPVHDPPRGPWGMPLVLGHGP